LVVTNMKSLVLHAHLPSTHTDFATLYICNSLGA
jgi:hypothetical protein